MKKTMKLSALCLAGATMLGVCPVLTGCNGSDQNSGENAANLTYVGVDVNPSLSLVLDGNGKVTAVIADNEDAQVLLYGESLQGKTAEEAARILAELSLSTGYLNENNRGVNLTFEGAADADGLTASFEGAFSSAVGDATAEFSVNFTSEGTFSLNRKLTAIKAEYPDNEAIAALTVGEYRLILKAQAADKSLTVEEAVSMSTADLIALVAEAATKVESYATAAFEEAMKAAEYTYEYTRGELLDSLWLSPYVKDLIAHAGREELLYSVNYGAIYKTYTSAARAFTAALNAVEKVAEAKEETALSDAALAKIADALELTDEEEQAFLDEMTENGKTLAALESYLDRYFKNMTADERAQAEQVFDEVLAFVQEEADKIDASIADEYKAALKKLCSDVTAMLPEDLTDAAKAYTDEFTALVNDLTAAIDGKEPLAAAYAAKDALNARAEKILQTMRETLTKEDLAEVEAAIAKADESLSAAYNRYTQEIERARTEAQSRLESLKQARLEIYGKIYGNSAE